MYHITCPVCLPVWHQLNQKERAEALLQVFSVAVSSY